MALVETTDSTGADVSINTDEIIGIVKAPTSIVPSSSFVEMEDGTRFVLPGDVATVTALLAAGAGVGVISFAMNMGTGAVLSANAAAIAADPVGVNNAPGDLTITFTNPPPGLASARVARMVTSASLGTGVVGIGGPPAANTLIVSGADYAGAGKDVDFYCVLIPTPA